MLDSIRKRKDNLIFTFLIAATAVVMGFFGVSQFDKEQQGVGGPAAYVNGEAISRREFQQAYEAQLMQYQQMLGGQYDEKFLAALQVPQRTLEQLVQLKLLAQQAKRLDIVVSDQELADHIRSIPYFQKDGRFDPELYRKIPNPGLEERRQRESLARSRLQNYLVDRIKLTPAETRRAVEMKETKVDLDYAKIDFNELASKAGVSGAEIDKYLKAAPQAELQAFYDANKKDFTEKAQARIRQIRVGIPYQAKEEQKAEARQKIDAIAKEVTPDNFAQLARTKSDDEYAKKGGDVGWVARGTLEPALEKAIDTLEKNRVSQPLETSFGFYVIQVVDKKPEVVQPLEAVKRKIAEKILVDRSKKSFTDSKKTEWEKLLAAGKPLEGELKKQKIEIKKTGPFSVGQGSIPGIGAADNIVDAIFNLSPKAPVAKQLFPVGEAYYYVKLRSVERPKSADFTKNAESAERSVESALQSEMIMKWVAQLQKTATVKTELKF